MGKTDIGGGGGGREGIEQGMTTAYERPRTDHVTSGPMKGLEKKHLVKQTNTQTDRQTNKQSGMATL